MPVLTLTLVGLTLAAAAAHAAAAIGTCLCTGNDDGPTRHRPHYSSSSLNSGASRIQTQPSYTPPPSYTYRPPATQAQTTPRTPALPDYSRGAYQPSAVSSYTRTPSQTQAASSICIQPPSSGTLTQQ